MICTQNLGFAFRRVSNGWVERSVSIAHLTMIFLPTRFSLAIFDDACALTFRTAVYISLSYHVSMIQSVPFLPLPDSILPTPPYGRS